MIKVGFICECGGPDPNRAGPDEQVCRYLASQLRPDITMVFRGLVGKGNLVRDCGPVARLLLKDGCARVFIIWDLFPPWRVNTDRPCRKTEREAVLQSLTAASVPLAHAHLVCIREELEAWLLADHKAVADILTQRKRPHRLTNRVKRWRNPDTVSNPKALLEKLFSTELGHAKRYVDYQDALTVIKGARLDKLPASDSYSRFHDLLMAV